MEEGKCVLKILTNKATRMGSLRKPRRRWEDNIRVDLKETGTNSRISVHSIHNREYWRALMNAASNLRVTLAMEFSQAINPFVI